MVCLMVILISEAQAAHIKFHQSMRTVGGVPVNVGDSTVVGITGRWACPYNQYKTSDIITFGVDHDNPAFIADSSVITVELLVNRYDGTDTTLELTINNNPVNGSTNYIDKQIYTFKNRGHYSVTITNIKINGVDVTVLPSYLYIDADLDMVWYFYFGDNALTPLTTGSSMLDNDCDGIDDEIYIYWDGICAAEEYQLEWTFINDYGTTSGTYLSESALDYDFRNNSTRITTANADYKITTAFEHGWLLYRVRGLGRDTADPTKILYGVWSVAEEGNVSLVASNSKHQITQEHEGKKNWQYSASYAEEGKKKEVISYFDGSLRNRESVTKLNSDSTETIVGQTIYDSQGRPAVNVLPVPVSKSVLNCTPSSEGTTAIKYYVRFNRDDRDSLYSRYNFDFDAGNCSSVASGMDSLYGASNYYSPENPNKYAQQAFLPDAQKYPFTQIQYTPDNTGRISRQSGVGPDFKIGSGHETKYYYGQPNQIQLDRMFGSEVGDATHYKKNLVFDANGQASVSYLDQEGRVIATSLAGDCPGNVEAIESEAGAVKTLTIDLFAKDANGHSNMNTIGIGNDSIVFNTQLLVAYNSNYTFDYDLSVDTMNTSCLCFNCVYDLTIKVISECGDTVPDNNNSLDYSHRHKIGHFTEQNGVISFSNDCSPTQYTDEESINISLTPGNYTISKILSINKNARNYFVQEYLDSCALTEQDFINEALANVDTSDCNITCSTCEEALGDRDEWVASGKGTAFEYDALFEECGKPCRTITVCEATYNQLLSDVSPGGQYAEYIEENSNNQITVNPVSFPLSLLNTSNQLPLNVTTGTAYWKHPKVKINGTDYTYYLDEDGVTRSFIQVTLNPDGITYTPLIDNGSAIYNSADGYYFVYPEHLANVEDFIQNWKTSWAKSLVQYHPEYCYYETCGEYTNTQKTSSVTTDTHTSDEFDELLFSTKTYVAAVSAGLFSGGVPTDYAINNTWPYDPFAHDIYYYETELDGIQDSLESNFNYYPGVSSSYTMYQMAAIAVRCGNQFGSTPGSSCDDFGANLYSSSVPNYVHLNDSIKDAEWNLFKSFYLAEKHRLQQKRADAIALTTCSAYNGCIGNDDFNPLTSGMIDMHAFNFWSDSPFFNMSQPCSAWYYMMYKDKIKRFSGPDDLTLNDPGYQAYLETGQCPLAFELQYWLSSMAEGHFLASSTDVDLQYHSMFTQEIYTAISGGTLPSTYIPYDWHVYSNIGDILTVQIKDGSNVACTMTFNKNGTGITSWNDVFGFKDLKYTSTSGGIYNFSAYAMIESPSGMATPYTFKLITGSTCINIAGCSFDEQCSANQLAHDMSNLWTALAINSDMGSTDISLQNTIYRPFKTTLLINTLGLNNPHLKWTYNSTDTQFEISDSLDNSKKLIIHFSSFDPSSFNISNFLTTVKGFTGITGNNQDGFIVKGVDINGDVVVTITGNVEKYNSSPSSLSQVSMGECGTPEPMGCQGPEYQLPDDLEALLQDVLLKEPFSANIDLTQSSAYTGLINSYMPTNTDVLGTSSAETSVYAYGFYYDILTFHIPVRQHDCHLELHSNNPDITLPFENLTNLGELVPFGSVASDNSYYSFYMLADYTVNNVIYHDTVFGESSCLPLKICPCPVETKTDINECTQNTSGEDCWKVTHLSSFTSSDPVSTVVTYIQNNTLNGYYDPFLNVSLYNFYPSAPNIVWYCPYSNGEATDYTHPYYVFNKNFTLTGNTGSFDLDLLPYCSAYVLINDNYVTQLVGNDYPGTILTVNGYGQYMHSGENNIKVILKVCNDNKLLAIAARGNIIDIQPCETAVDTFYSPTFTPGSSPCAEYLTSVAVENAENAYNEYRDSLITEISAAYTEHCLGAVENFAATYDDKEYHFTLYYYDQAGNLIKTIPPEGVELFNITSSSSPDEVKIITDRTNGTHTVFTDHRMETRYEYNSLNQLVKQVMPDHDKMNIWEYTLPNGLDKRLQITSTQFVNSTKGYLTGYIDIGGVLRGYLYASNDAGATWIKVNDLVAANLSDVQMVDASNGFASGSDGILLKTTNGGVSWDMIPLYSYGISANINALYFSSTSSGVIAGDNGTALYTSNAGVTFAVATGITATDTITAITYDGANYYASAIDADGMGKIYKSSDDGHSWVEQSNIAGNNLAKVKHIAALSKWFAVGVDGGLLSSNDGVTWKTIPTATSGNFKDVWFKTANYGVAIIENNSGNGQIWKTTDGGQTWTLLSAPNSIYNAFYFYDNTLGKGYAVGNNELVSRIVFSSSIPGNVNLLPIPTTGTGYDLNAVHSAGDGTKIWMASNGYLHYCNNATATTPSWNHIGFSGNDTKDIFYNYSTDNGIVLTSAGAVYKITPSGNSYALTSITSTEDITDMEESGNYIAAYDINSSGVMRYVDKTDIANATAFSAFGSINNVPNTTNFRSLGAIAAGGTLVTSGDNGDIYKGAISGTTITWENESQKVKPLELNDIKYTGSSSTLIAVGSDGTVLRTTDGTNWQSLTTGTVQMFNAICPTDATHAGIVGNGGYVASLSVVNQYVSSLTQMSSGTTNNIYDLAINGTKAYAVGANGTVLYCADISVSVPIIQLAVGSPQTANFKGVAFTGSSNAVAIGGNGMVYNFAVTSGVKNKNVYTPNLREANFINANEGYVIGETGTIRHTSDGGITWKVVLPNIISNTTPQLNGVWTTQVGKALLVGNGGYAASVLSNNEPVSIGTITTSDNLNDVVVNSGGTGYIVGDNGAGYKSVNNGVSWTTLATGLSLNALHMFIDNTFIAVGDNASVCTYDGTSIATTDKNTGIASGATLNDVFFHDDRNGYIAGNRGLLYKCTLTENASATATAITWLPKPTTDEFGLTDSTHVHITSIDFPSRYKGFVAGTFNTTNTTKYPYARLLRDESEMYSAYFWYDKLGRMVVSQNTKQFNKIPKAYSYTRYDILGRIVEVGEKAENTSDKFKGVFGTYVNFKFNPNAIDDDSLKIWITDASGARTEVTRTFYDNTILNIADINQENLRNRVADVTYSDVFDTDSTIYNYASHYSYDIHGNVKTLWQDNPALAAISSQLTSQRFKRIDYNYDLVSGKVNDVCYEHDSLDAFAHHYEYDADNKITQVYTSKYPEIVWTGEQSDPLWDMDAKYFYYKHGPLARVELGNDKVQGIDYAYTLQGWMKSVNSETLDSTRDMGLDGYVITGNNDSMFAKDIFGYTLNYFHNDYNSITASPFIADTISFGNTFSTNAPNLYNGNIRAMVTSITNPTNGNRLPMLTAYKYDQLNRIKSMKAFDNIDIDSNKWENSGWTDKYKSTFEYDANGNLKTLARYAANGNIFDNFTYNYLMDGNGKLMQNRLYHINDAATPLTNGEDITDQGTFMSNDLSINRKNNYNYDEIGNLRKDSTEGIANIEWTVYGKVKSITRYDGFSKTVNSSTIYPSDLEFLYDATGNRIAKIEKTRDASGLKSSAEWKNTYYIRDAQGNEMAIYKYYFQNTHAHFKLTEQPMFGSSRLGSDYDTLELISALPQSIVFSHTLGNKQFELSNHLSTILTTMSDRKVAQETTTGSGIIGYYNADITSSQDYYPFGMLMPERNFSSNIYIHGYQGSERDGEITETAGNYTTFNRELDTRACRWWSVDSKFSAWESPYVSMGNNPIVFNDIMGDTIRVQGTAANASGPAMWTYKNGGFYDAKGNQYSKGADTYVDEVISSIEKISTGGVEGKRLIENLSSNPKYVDIAYNKGYQVSGGSFVWMDFGMSTSVFDEGGESKMDNWLILAHELAHSENFIEGKTDNTIWDYVGTKPVTNDEKYATHIENKIRAENGMKLRTYYGILTDGTYKSTNVGALPILSSKGQSLYYKDVINVTIKYSIECMDGIQPEQFEISMPYDYRKNTNNTSRDEKNIENTIN